MSDLSSSDAKKPIEQPSNDLSEAMEQLSVNSDETSPSLSDMPVDVVGLIIERSEYKQQLKLRKVSKSLREFVDKQKPACKSIKVVCYLQSVDIYFDNHHVIYTNLVGAYEDYDRTITVMGDDFKKTVFDDLASTLKNPKLQLEEFVVVDNSFKLKVMKENCNEIRKVLESLNHKLSAKEFASDLPFPSCVLSILPYLKPGVLERITLYLYNEVDSNTRSTEMDQVAILEQWKQAKELELLNSFDWFLMKYATHFKRFYIHEQLIDDDKFARIKNYLSKLDNFEQCTLSCKQFAQRIDGHQLLGKPVSSSATEEVFHYRIHDSDDFFEFKKAKDSDDVKIVKKKRGDK